MGSRCHGEIQGSAWERDLVAETGCFKNSWISSALRYGIGRIQGGETDGGIERGCNTDHQGFLVPIEIANAEFI